MIEKKTGKPKRFPINTKQKPLLDKFTQGREDSEPLFLSRFYNRMERTQCYRIINSACEIAGVDYKFLINSTKIKNIKNKKCLYGTIIIRVLI